MDCNRAKQKKSITRFQFTISSINIKVSSYRNLLANRNQAQTTRMVNEHHHKYNSPAGIATSSNDGCTKLSHNQRRNVRVYSCYADGIKIHSDLI